MAKNIKDMIVPLFDFFSDLYTKTIFIIGYMTNPNKHINYVWNDIKKSIKSYICSYGCQSFKIIINPQCAKEVEEIRIKTGLWCFNVGLTYGLHTIRYMAIYG